MRRSAIAKWQAFAAAAAIGLAAWALAMGPAQGRTEAPELPVVVAAQLPPQGQEVLRQIRSGGPFRYEKDGTVFGNRERLLPLRTRGFYREYTVPTPGLKHRGARRIVCGGERPASPEVCYYTADHYASFRRIVQ